MRPPSALACGLVSLAAFSASTARVAMSASTTFYVDEASIGGHCSDSNAGTSITAPWCDLPYAAAHAAAGSTVDVRAGTYPALNLGSFAPAATVTFAGFGSEHPVMPGLTVGSTTAPLAQNVAFTGFKFTKTVSLTHFANINLSGNEIAITPAPPTNCTGSAGTLSCAVHTPDGVDLSSDGSSLTLSGNYIHDADLAVVIYHPTSATAFAGATIAHNRFARNGGVVMHVYDTKGWTIEGNEFADNGVWSDVDPGVHPDAIHVVGSDDGLVLDGNYVHAHAGAADGFGGTLTRAGRGFLFQPTNGASQPNVALQNNVIAGDSSDFGIRMLGGVAAPRIVNNTIWMNGTSANMGIELAGSIPNVVMENNVAREFDVLSGVTFAAEDYNDIVVRKSGNGFATPPPGAHDIAATPSFVSSVAPGWNFRLAAGSAGIDRASSTVAPALDADGSDRITSVDPVPDMGAYEYASSSTPPPTGFTPLSTGYGSAFGGCAPSGHCGTTSGDALVMWWGGTTATYPGTAFAPSLASGVHGLRLRYENYSSTAPANYAYDVVVTVTPATGSPTSYSVQLPITPDSSHVAHTYLLSNVAWTPSSTISIAWSNDSAGAGYDANFQLDRMELG